MPRPRANSALIARRANAALFAVLAASPLVAQPAGYYAGIDESSIAALRASLHAAIDDHTWFPYTAGSTDTWDILASAQQDPGNALNIIDVNRNASYPKQRGGNTFYDRDHIWPRSYGFPNLVTNNYPFTDCHALMLSDIGYNGTRGSRLYEQCTAACSERPTLNNNGQGGGAGVYPGNSNWYSGSSVGGVWQQWRDRRGDVARAVFYMDVRYEGGRHGSTGAVEPDLIVSDDKVAIAASQTGQNLTTAYFGLRSTLLAWHRADPVDAFERRRNDVVFGFQRNRNPFVDQPAWADCLFGGPFAAAQLVRAGTPPNPTALRPGTTPPEIGAVWNPWVDHAAFAPTAATDWLLLSPGTTNAPTPWGTLLCSPTPALIVAVPAGNPFALPIPPRCALAGGTLCAQAFAVDIAGVQLTNALDVTIGMR